MAGYDKEMINTKVSEAKQKLFLIFGWLRKNPISLFVVIGLFLIMIFVISFSGKGDTPSPHPLLESAVPFAAEGQDMIGVKESVDPRDVWTNKVEQKVQDTKDLLSKQLDEKNKAAEEALHKVNEELSHLKSLVEKQRKMIEDQQTAASLGLSNAQTGAVPAIKLAPKKSLGLFTKEYSNKKRSIKDYIISGTFARAVLMTGVVVGTGSNSVSNPEPIMLRLTDAGMFSKGKRTEQIKEAILIGDCSGDLSSERAKCRLQTLSLVNMQGETVERPVQGWIVGEDGRFGVKGVVVDKSSDMLRMAMLNGVLGGFSQFLQNQSTKSVFPVSPLTGQQNALSGANTLKGGLASGAGDAFSKMADFVMERFNSMSPQIVIASGREVDVVFQHGVDLNSSLENGAAEGNLMGANNYLNNRYSNSGNPNGNLNNAYPNSNPNYPNAEHDAKHPNYQPSAEDTANLKGFHSVIDKVQANDRNHNQEQHDGF